MAIISFDDRISHFDTLGNKLIKTLINDEAFLNQVYISNNWFTKEYVKFALTQWGGLLNKNALSEWMSQYHIDNTTVSSKNIGVIMAGNIPMVGFHDALCVLITGNKLYAKLSSQDTVLTKKVLDLLINIDSRWAEMICFVDRLNNVDAVIATGSNNSARYFHQYFASKPHIIRKNRTSVAVLTGNETDAEIEQISKDIFTYFGLGCRNVTKLFVPSTFGVEQVYPFWEKYSYHLENHKYKNNYDYQRAVHLVNQVPFFDNGFLMMKETTELFAPIGILYFEKYNSTEQLMLLLSAIRDDTQAIASSENSSIEGSVIFGNLQKPQLDDYADGVDTIDFLAKV